MTKKLLFTAMFIAVVAALFMRPVASKLPVVAIANYGPHASLEATIQGFKEQMILEGFIENKTVRFDIADIGFDQALIPQMIARLKASKPKLMVVMATPVAQFAKGTIHNIPLVYSVITDPVDAGLIIDKNMPDKNMTGASDMQDLESFIKFAQSMLPNAKRIGLLYATSDSNDAALLKMMRKTCSSLNVEVVAIPVEQSRDVPLRVQEFKGKVDLIYVGTSGPVQPTLPAIAAAALEMHIPVFNAESQAVRDGLALASYGVDYIAIGNNTAKLAAAILNGEDLSKLLPTYPTAAAHRGVVNQKIAKEFGAVVPAVVEIVE
jgi:putative tryptophan/tyrosine transport system substrate-binding protein